MSIPGFTAHDSLYASIGITRRGSIRVGVQLTSWCRLGAEVAAWAATWPAQAGSWAAVPGVLRAFSRHPRSRHPAR